MIYLDVDAALAEVPVNLCPLTDSTDFKTVEDTVAYNAAGLALYWNFVTSAGAYTRTQVTPTTGGDYDWTHQGGGMYTIEIPASGGASINNDTEGYGWFTGVADGVLPWRGPTIGFRASGLNDLLTDSAYSTTRGLAGTALPPASAGGAGGIPVSDAGGLDLDAKLAATNEVTAARMGALTDWIDGGRLDLLIDAVKGKTDSLTFTVAGDVDVNVQTWGGTAISTPPAVNATQISGDSTAADTLELFAEALDQTTGQIDSGTFAAGAIDAAAIANAAIDAATFAADVDAEILSYLVDDNTRLDGSLVNAALGQIGTLPNLGGGATLGDNLTDIDASLNGIASSEATIVNMLRLTEGTIGSTGNTTTTLHLDGLTFPDGELNDHLIVFNDDSAGEQYVRWITGWVASTEVATLHAALPATPENAVDTYRILTVKRDWVLPSTATSAQTGDAYDYLTTNLGAAGANATEVGGTGDHLSAVAPASTALSTSTWTGTLATNLGTTNTTVATNLNATITSRMATFTLPTNFSSLAISGAGGVTLADGVSHGGTLGSSTATLALSRITVTSQTSDTSAVTITGNGTGHGVYVLSGSGATGNAIYAVAASTNGHASRLEGVGTGSGFYAVGGNSNAAGMAAVGGTGGDGLFTAGGAGGVSIYAAGGITGNITGNLSGSAGSVTGGIGTSGGTITTLDALNTAQDAQHTTTQSSLSTVSGNVTTLLNRIGAWTGSGINTLLGAFRALFRSDADVSVPSDINTDLGSGAGTAASSTDSLQAIRGNMGTAQTGDTYALASGASGFAAIKIDTAAILLDTDELQTDWANGGRLDVILDASAAQFTTQMTESYNADGTAPTPAQALFVCMQRLTEFSISGTEITVKQLDGSTTAYTLTLDSTSPTSSTRAT